MKTKTTARENLLRTLRRQGFDWAPLDSGLFSAPQIEAFKARFGHDRVGEYFGNPCEDVALRLEAPRSVPPKSGGKAPRLKKVSCPLQGEVSLDEIVRHPLPVIAPGAQDDLARQVRGTQARGLAANAPLGGTIWDAAWGLRSMEDLMVDMMADDGRATVLFDRITALACERARAYARAGADILSLGDEIGMQHSTMMSLALWRKWLKPRLAAVIRAAKETRPDILALYHSCGYVQPFLEDLIGIGVDVLNPLQSECMALSDVHAQCGGRVSYWGTLGSQRLLPFGTPEDVFETVHENLRLCGDAGGIVIAPTHVVGPEVPWENLAAMKEAVEAW